MAPILRTWELGSGIFFLYVAVAAVARPGLTSAVRLRVLALSAGGLALTAASALAPPIGVLHGWLIPPALLLLAYWTSGLLFVAPMPRVERWLAAVDRAWSIRRVSGALPRPVVETLEIAYAGVYLLIPLALAVHLGVSRAADPERFWTVILVTDYVCFAALPWIQTRPPRALEPGEPWQSDVRTFNLRLLGATSIQVNTCPSGHAAEGLAAALLVLDAPIGVAAAFVLAAIAVSCGAVFGRYHYAIDAVAGWAVAIAVWSLM